jgi:hypothetical protein
MIESPQLELDKQQTTHAAKMATTSQNSVFEAPPAAQATGHGADLDKKNPNSPSSVLIPDGSTSSIRRGSVEQPYRTYKIRWFGLVVLTLLNVMVSWSVCRSCRHSFIERLAHLCMMSSLPLHHSSG